MLFEVKKDGIVKMSTTYEICIYDRQIRRLLRDAGYKLYLDGKEWRG